MPSIKMELNTWNSKLFCTAIHFKSMTNYFNNRLRCLVTEELMFRNKVNFSGTFHFISPAQGVGSNGPCVRSMSIGTQFMHGAHF